MGRIVSLNPNAPAARAIASGAEAMARGKVIVFPTTGLYGLGADAFNPEAVQKIFRIKNRPKNKPVLVLINDIKDVDSLVREIPKNAIQLMKALWPGGLTLVFHAADTITPELCGTTKKIGIRMAAHPVARALIKKIGNPITGTSANISGARGPSAISDISSGLKQDVSLVLDAGPLVGGVGSTIVDITQDPPKILRQGAVLKQKIMEVLQ